MASLSKILSGITMGPEQEADKIVTEAFREYLEASGSGPENMDFIKNLMKEVASQPASPTTPPT